MGVGLDEPADERIVCANVSDHSYVPPESWGDGFYRVFPLPGLTDGAHAAAQLDDLFSVEAGTLESAQRLACLGHRGIVLLQQRLVFCLTRCLIDLPTLKASMDGVLQEASLQQDWVEDLAESAEAVAAAVRDFDRFVSEDGLRDLLQTESRRSDAVRQVSREIARRRGPSSAAED